MLKRNQLPLDAVRAMQKAMTMPGIDARTLLKIGLEAWPGMERHTFKESGSGDDYCPPIDEIFLPLPTEARDGD